LVTIVEALKNAKHQLENITPTPVVDAELLLIEILQADRTLLFSYPERSLTDDQWIKYRRWLSRRVKGEPVAYILGHAGFWTLDLRVTQDTLIPRPETEHIIEWVLDRFSGSDALKLADLGTGSGAIALSLASECPSWEIMATDISTAALAVARDNAMRCKVSNITFAQGEWCQALASDQFNIIISNPPYIVEGDAHLEALHYEPIGALVAGDNGLAAIKIIVPEARNHLKTGGCLVLEHGYDQGVAVARLMKEAGFSEVDNHLDLAGHSRFTHGVMASSQAQ
jgi:release factor glutamine methyltransferase